MNSMLRRWMTTAILLCMLSLCPRISADNGYVALYPSGNVSRTWSAATCVCSDGMRAAALSSLPSGEILTGTLRTKDFDCPAKLSFWLAGHSNQNKNFIRLRDAVTSETYKSQPPPGNDIAQLSEWNTNNLAGRRVYLELEDGDSGTGHAWMAVSRIQPDIAAIPYSDDTATLSDWTETTGTPQVLYVDGIPFFQTVLWAPAIEGGRLTIDTHGLQADSLFLLGCINSVDEGGPGWGGADSFANLFVGDRAGYVRIIYRKGTIEEIPLIFGYTIWWRVPYNIAPEPFRSSASAIRVLDDALCVANGLEGKDKPYFLKIGIRSDPIEKIEIIDNPEKRGHPLVNGLTFGGVKGAGWFDDHIFKWFASKAISKAMSEWLKAHTVDTKEPLPVRRRRAISKLGRLMYTYPDQVNHRTIRCVKPAVTKDNYPGPKVRFTGPPEAGILTNVYYENSSDLLTRVDDTGMVHESGAGADNYGGFGGYTPGLQPFFNASYTRLRALTVLTNTGFDIKVARAIIFFDRWLMYFPRSFPGIQMAGKPIPGHATVIANTPHVYFDALRGGGWPTKYTTRDYGNPEVDGHGLLMVTRWRAWVKAGRTAEWVKKRWEALDEAAEYIPWCLDNPNLSFSEHGLLYSESEGGMQMVSLYCNVPCYLGLLAYAEMAEAAGREDKASRWRQQAQRLLSAMNFYFATCVDTFGDVWDPVKAGGWGPATALAPIVLGMDLYGLDASRKLPKGWDLRTRNTYKMQITKTRPPWCSPAGIGYNQCYYAQASLLLDQMSDAANFVNWMSRFCFAPNLPHPYRVPEGVAMTPDGSVWRRWGDLGNLYQMAEVLYTVHIMLGIDDLEAGTLKLMPRLPNGWTGMEFNGWPVRSKSAGKSVLTSLSMTLKRRANEYVMVVTAEKPIDDLRVRVGPFPMETDSILVTINKKAVQVSVEQAGDSKWAWINLRGSTETNYDIKAGSRACP